MIAAEIESAVGKLDDLLRWFADGPPSEESEIVREHVPGARVHLLGAMNAEYVLNLKLAQDAAAAIPDQATRARARVLLSELIEPNAG